LADYNNSFRKFQAYLDGKDPPIDEITVRQVRQFLDHLGTIVVAPAGIARRPARPLSKKTILNIHTGLSALWTWAIREEYASDHIIRRIRPAKPEQKAIDPMSREDIELLISACDYSRPYIRPGKKQCSHARPTAERDKLVIRFLLDTGVRVSELCGLCIKDIDLRNNRVKVFGKGAKERIIPIGKRLCKAIWRYLAARPDADPDDPFLLNNTGEDSINRFSVRRVLKRLGERAGVRNVYPHRFRHTFALSYLRNGGSEFTLTRILGHSTMEMTRRYAKIVQSDVQQAHKRASPLDNWKL